MTSPAQDPLTNLVQKSLSQSFSVPRPKMAQDLIDIDSGFGKSIWSKKNNGHDDSAIDMALSMTHGVTTALCELARVVSPCCIVFHPDRSCRPVSQLWLYETSLLARFTLWFWFWSKIHPRSCEESGFSLSQGRWRWWIGLGYLIGGKSLLYEVTFPYRLSKIRVSPYPKAAKDDELDTDI